jgi:Kef-type K+ transport system membrane component KefB
MHATDAAERMLAALDSRLRGAVGEILIGFALLDLGVVVAILACVPGISNPGTVAVALVAALLGLIFAVRGANDFRR